jgi:glucose-6-phosphate isomerase
MGARDLFEACCHPYHNELSRAERGSRPRLYFEGNNVDNDAQQGLLDLLGRGRTATGLDDSWGVVVISKSGGTLETAVAFRQFLAALKDSVGGNTTELVQRVIPITGKNSKLHQLCQAVGCPSFLPVPDGVGGRYSILSAVGLVPAAIMGLDVVRLLEGARAMNEHFQSASPDCNVVMQYVGVCHLMEKLRGAATRVLSVWSSGLEAVGLWYDQLLAESLGKELKGALPLTVVNTRDLHSRGQQHQEGARDKLITNLVVDSCRRGPLTVGNREWDQDKLNCIAETSVPQIMSAAIEGTNRAYLDDNRPTTNFHLPAADEASLGQLFQMLMIATVVEGRLIGINPYGQPGVEAYKREMKAILGL